ncbi:hypothetical protein BD413DRAFT_608595 [Trametes elegans]|nr:hypothetical protein BD413DRAFT_608595 [Trametes elegans]
MKVFSTLLAVAGLVATIAPDVAAQKSQDVINSIGVVSQTVKNLEKQVKRVSQSNIEHEGSSVAQGISTLSDDIASEIQNVFESSDEGAVYGPSTSKDVIGVLGGLVPTVEGLFQALIDFHSLAEQYLLTDDIAKALRGLGINLSDYVAFISATSPSQSEQSGAISQSVAEEAQAVITTYEI